MIPFVLLALSICAVWAPNLPPVGGKALPSWLVLFTAAVVAGPIVGLLTWPAVLALVLLTALAWASERQKAAGPRRVLIALAVVLALAIALHRVPGFFNPLIADRIRITPDAAPFTLYANFDKGAAGAVLLAFFAPRARTWKELGAQFSPLLLGAVVTSTVVFGTALAIGYVRVEPKYPDLTPIFLALNLFFVCVAEEAMFRGLLQERMTLMLEGRGRHWQLVPIAVSALLFGAVHAAGGPQLILLATLAGLGYSWTYARTRKIEAAILVHFIVNAAQFLLLTYPNIQR
jgi:uncharacterized protein